MVPAAVGQELDDPAAILLVEADELAAEQQAPLVFPGHDGGPAQDGQDGVVGPRADVGVEGALDGAGDGAIGINDVGEFGVAVKVEADKVLLLAVKHAVVQGGAAEEAAGEDAVVSVDEQGINDAPVAADAVAAVRAGQEEAVDVAGFVGDAVGHRHRPGGVVGGGDADRAGQEAPEQGGAVAADNQLGLGGGDFADPGVEDAHRVLAGLQGDGEGGEIYLGREVNGGARAHDAESIVRGAGRRVLRLERGDEGRETEEDDGGAEGTTRGRTANHRQGASLRGPPRGANWKIAQIAGSGLRVAGGRKDGYPAVPRF